jgi:hypothetical protein
MQRRIFVDFMKTDAARRLILTTLGTKQDLARAGIELREGLNLSVYSDDLNADGNPDNLLAEGVVHYDKDAKRWVLEIDWSGLRHEVDAARLPGDGRAGG